MKSKNAFTKAIMQTWLQFSQRTSINGIKFITEKDGSRFTKYNYLKNI